MCDVPIIPDYANGTIASVIPALLGPQDWAASIPDWMPDSVAAARQICLLVLDGVGWDQLREYASIAPNLAALQGGPITSVAPTTTATALASIVTGATPGEHGLVGYRMMVSGEVLNVLRWAVDGADRSRQLRPETLQRFPAFLGKDVPVVTPEEFAGTSFSAAHLRGAEHVGYRAASSMPIEVGRQLAAGKRFVYAYYGGVDKIAHERGFGEFYEAELAAADRLVGQILDRLPAGAILMVTADHGQVEVGGNIVYPAPEVLALSASLSGEGRFRWFHARKGARDELLEACRSEFGDSGWVYSRQQLIDLGVFGPTVGPQVERRLGDVAVLARDNVSYFDPLDSGPFELICRHGSLTSAEVLVPLVASAP